MASARQPARREDFRTAILCALVLEYDAISLIFDRFWDEDGDPYGKAPGDTNQYTTGRIGKHDVVLVLSSTGKAAAAGAAASLRSSYTRLDLIFLVGVCGGVPHVRRVPSGGSLPSVGSLPSGRKDEVHEVLLGDVVIGDMVFQYDFGRQHEDRFETKDAIEDSLGRPNKTIRGLIAIFKTKMGRERLQKKAAERLQDLQLKADYCYPGPNQDKLFLPTYLHQHHKACIVCGDGPCAEAALASCEELGCEDEYLVPRERLGKKQQVALELAQAPTIFVGRIGSADSVMRSSHRRDELAKERQLIAFEMEGAGVWDEVPCIVIKGISDYADSHKDKHKGWHNFAAATAAATTRAVLDQYSQTDPDRLAEAVPYQQPSELPPLPIAGDARFDSHAEEHNPQCHADTRIDLLSQIRTWAEDPHSQSVFWLSGMAGTGKSTISRTVAKYLQDQGMLGASFFFKRGEQYRGDAARFFTSLAVDMASRVPGMVSGMTIAIKADPSIPQMALGVQFENLIMNPLKNTHHPTTIVIVVDALDECIGDKDARAIISLLADLKTSGSVNMKAFITSRPELPIRLGFSKIEGRYENIALHEVEAVVVERDLHTYLRSELTRIKDDHNCEASDSSRLPLDWPGDEVVRTLARLAVPLFIFAATVCRFLEDPVYDPRSQLDKVLLSQTKPGGSQIDQLDATYLPVLEQLVAGRTGADRELRLQEFRDILGPIILLATPLSMTSLSRLIDIPGTSISPRLRLLHSVLNIPSQDTAPIRLFHLSFRDFLVNPVKRGTEFWIDEEQTHETLAGCCLRIMKDHLKKDICDLREPGVSLAEVDGQILDACLPPELQYACLNWANHLDLGKVSVDEEVYTFLKSHFLHWLEALCLLGKGHESINMVKVLRKRCQPGTSVDKHLRDINRFIQNCIAAASQYPLQLYSSAIFFSPEKSLVREEAQKEMSDWLVQGPAMEDGWGACTQRLEGHRGLVCSIAISPDSNWLASGSGDGTIKLWDIETGNCTQSFQAYTNAIEGAKMNQITISPDNSWLASGSVNSLIHIWNLATGACIRTLECHSRFSPRIAISSDSNRLTATFEDNSVQIWDIATGELGLDFNGRQDRINSTAISGDGSWLAVGSGDTIDIWDVVKRVRTKTLKGHDGKFTSIAISPDGCSLASVSDRSVKIWDVVTNACIEALGDYGSCTELIAISSDRNWLTSRHGNVVKIWDVATGVCEQKLDSDVSCPPIDISTNNKWLALPPYLDQIRVLDLARGIRPQTLESHHYITCVTISSNGHWLASGSLDGSVRILDIAMEADTQTTKSPSGQMEPIAISSDGNVLAWTADNDTIKVRSMATGATGTSIRVIETDDNGGITALAVSSNGHWLAAIFAKCTMKIWNIETEIKVRKSRPSRLSPFINSIAISSNGNLMAFGIFTKVTVWDTARGAELLMIENDENFLVTSIAISYDGHWLACSSIFGAVTIWDLVTRTCTQRLLGPRAMYCLAFTLDSGLCTDIGTINLDLNPLDITLPKASEPPTEDLKRRVREFGIEGSREWIVRNGHKLLWLPPQYRLVYSIVMDRTILGVTENRLLEFRFSADKPVA